MYEMNQLRYKGRLISQKQYNKRLKASENAKKLKKLEAPEQAEMIRVVDLNVIGDNLNCIFCDEKLSLQKKEKEIRHGFASILLIRCENCLQMNSVPTGRKHKGPQGYTRFSTNTKLALGLMHAGIGATKFNKALEVAGIPSISNKTLKAYEREIGPVVEDVAKESCLESCNLERQLTLKNLDELTKLLPEGMDRNFLTPNTILSEQNTEISCMNNKLIDNAPGVNSSKIVDNNNNSTVRVFASFDAAWSTRGAGTQYDGLNGYSSLIGKESGRVLDYTTRTRKCRKCDLGYSKNSHDCRHNYNGSAKGMEPDMAVELVTKSNILKEQNIKVGVFIGDNDSSSICHIRKNTDDIVLKQSDKNHTSKGVYTLLKNIGKTKDPDNELNFETIKYLKKCFNYAVSQNAGNTENMATAIKNIPYHSFNFHDNCKEWCKYAQDKENYRHQVIGKGLKNDILFVELKRIFNNLASNAATFSAAASTQANESLNGSMARRTPKSECYSTSETTDYRFASVVAEKNLGEEYLIKTLDKYGLDPGDKLKTRVKNVLKISTARSIKSKTPQFKKNRLEVRKRRSELKYRKESSEGITYKKNVGLMQPLQSIVPEIFLEESNKVNGCSENCDNMDIDMSMNIDINIEPSHFEKYELVFYDLETSGLHLNANVLQIAMKCGELTFNKYINPTQTIPANVTKVNNLKNVGGDLHYHGVHVVSYPIKVVLTELLEYLKSINKLCILVAHQNNFDGPRLLRAIKNANLCCEYKNVIGGFVDTLQLLKNKFPDRKSKGAFKLTTLASDINLSSSGAHDALNDVIMLENVTFHHFNTLQILERVRSYNYILTLPQKKQNVEILMKTLEPLNEITTKTTRKKFASAYISYKVLLTKSSNNDKDFRKFIEQKVDGDKPMIRRRKEIEKILDHFKKLQ